MDPLPIIVSFDLGKEVAPHLVPGRPAPQLRRLKAELRRDLNLRSPARLLERHCFAFELGVNSRVAFVAIERLSGSSRAY